MNPELEAIIAAAVDAALAEVRRQGGPEYLLQEARNEGMSAGAFAANARAQTTASPPSEERLAILEERHATLARRLALVMNAHLLLRRHIVPMCGAPGCQRVWVKQGWLPEQGKFLLRCEKHPMTTEEESLCSPPIVTTGHPDLAVSYSNLIEKLIEEVGLPCP